MHRFKFITFLVGVSSIIGCTGMQWLAKETEHLMIHYKPNSYAETNINSAAQCYENAYCAIVSQLALSEVLTDSNKIICYLLEKHPWWSSSVMGYVDYSTRSVYNMYSKEVQLVSAHEMTHILLYDINPDAPHCLNEGICRVFEVRTIQFNDSASGKLVKEGCELYRFAKFQSPAKWDIKRVFSYSVFGWVGEEDGCLAAAFTYFLIRRIGAKSFILLYSRLNHNWEPILTAYLNMSFEEINKAFKEYGKLIVSPSESFSKLYGLEIPKEWKE
jgi:hypothetical protein